MFKGVRAVTPLVLLLKQLSMFYHRQPTTGAVICSEGYQRMQELGGKRRETTIYTGSVRRKVTAPYVQSGVDSILRPALFVVFVFRYCLSRSRDPCPPLYSPGEAGVLVGYKVEILIGLYVTSPNRITCRES